MGAQDSSYDPAVAMVKLSPEFADTVLSSLAERLRFLTARLP